MAKKIEDNEGRMPNNDLEFWEDVPEYEDRYMISNHGRLKSIIKNKHIILKENPSMSGRLKVRLFDRRGRGKSYGCAKLTAKVFLGEMPENNKLIHVDGNPFNFKANNLKYIPISKSQREIAGQRKGRKQESNGMAILSIEQVKEIRKKRSFGEKLENLKHEYNVSIGCIHKIVTNKNWKNI